MPHIISDEELDAINKAVKSRYGIDFSSYEQASFKRRVSRVIAKLDLNGVYELWTSILKKPDFIYTFIDELTVGLTDLFRNPDLWAHIRDELLPQYKDQQEVNIWHAGCSTGEEVYTTAITLYDAGLLQKSRQLAVDVNNKFIRQAKTGDYPSHLKTGFEKNYKKYNPNGDLSTFFQEDENGGLKVRPFLCGNMRFQNMNLVRDEPNEKFDIVFCRNVMIYFDTELKLKLLEQYRKLLKKNGVFIIGYFDALPTGYKEHMELLKPSFKIFGASKD